ncbi:hypothetical protein [Priestia megaterium]|uniref:hypothetical protein n=1 Tax=Priestia megaterium TaxID=1404 RepID=UPI0030087A4C
MEWNNEKKKQGNDRLISFFIVGVMVRTNHFSDDSFIGLIFLMESALDSEFLRKKPS